MSFLNGAFGTAPGSAAPGGLFPTGYAGLPLLTRTTLSNGANTIGAPGGPSVDGDVRVYHMKQPASGAVGTITWNAAFLFPTGYVANLSTTVNHVDLFEFTYDSTAVKWRATRMIGGYAS